MLRIRHCSSYYGFDNATDDLESQIFGTLASKAKENDFQQTIELLQIDAAEVFDEISHSVAEVGSLRYSNIHFIRYKL